MISPGRQPVSTICPPYFNQSVAERDQYQVNIGFSNNRSQALNLFSQRLFKALERKEEFDKVLKKIIDQVPDWIIDQSDQGQYYLKIGSGGHNHSSDGLGDGVVSILFLVDALYDSKPEDVIVIDEPELSLHPRYQQRVLRLLANYAKDRQIVYATHSPYFVSFEHILNGAEIARVHKRDAASLERDLT